ncbi:hypothetical protein AB1Y20_005458 [Prymnesium parvum]|uniref:Protein kish n=1 Tax=Prymnesium parvum TaxID=97485 RepID=A0AB34J4C7_PRYPA
MTNLYSVHGFLTACLLVICSCAYIKRVPQLRNQLLREKHGARGTLYKAAIIGQRLHWQVSIACVLMAVYLLLRR